MTSSPGIVTLATPNPKIAHHPGKVEIALVSSPHYYSLSYFRNDHHG